jgi:hypothetical protein
LGASGGGKMKIDLSDPLTLGIIASLIAGVILAFFGYLLSRLRKSGFGMFELFRRRSKEKTGLEIYRQTLEDRTLRISHPWMKEEQILTDILVPINFQSQKTTQREELEIYLARESWDSTISWIELKLDSWMRKQEKT